MLVHHILHQFSCGICLSSVIQPECAKCPYERIVWFLSVVELLGCFIKLPHVHVNKRATITRHHMSSGIQTDESIIATQRSTILTIESMQKSLNEIDYGFIRRLFAGAVYFVTCLLFLTAPQVDKHHEHSRFPDLFVNRECFPKSFFSLLVVFCATKAFE